MRLPAAIVFCLALSSWSTASDLSSTIAQQRNAAIPRTQFIPFYSIAENDETELFFVSKITDPLAVDVFLTNPAGERVYLGREVVPPSRNVSINLRARLGANGQTFESGNIRLDFIGDGGALQSWAVVRSGRQSFEVPFVPSDKVAVNDLFSYWDVSFARPGPKSHVEYRVTNTTSAAVSYTLTVSSGIRVSHLESAVVGPLQTRIHAVSDGETTRTGWLKLTHAGPAGALIGGGLVAAAERIAYLPVFTIEAMNRGPRFEVLRIPAPTGRNARTRLTLFNPSADPHAVTLEGVTEAAGTVAATHPLTLEPWEVASVDVGRLFGPVANLSRVRIRGGRASLMVDGVVIAETGESLDLSIHAALSAHKSGTYPIPDLDRYTVRTTLLNLGKEESEITAQYFWDGGTYAVPLFRVPPGSSVVLDPLVLALDAKPDILKRTLDGAGKHLALKWSVQSGSRELIGRTEARLRGAEDGFGFNCGGCCFSIPRGAIEPAEVDFAAGESPAFESVVYYDTCSGTVGPYGTGGTWTSVPAPFSWNFMTISATDGAEADIEFSGTANQVDYGCLETREGVGASGRAKTCDKTLNPLGYKTNKPCVEQTTTCGTCRICCHALYNTAICKGASPAIQERELEDCLFRCENERCN